RAIASGSTVSVLKLSATSTRAEVGGWIVIGGERRGIRAVSGVAVTLDAPLATVPAYGTSVSVTAGCARTRAACRAKGNITYFGGTPDVPTSEE
ncbi:MAG TPA: phage BR0599 family protein, partial [Anaeromyxobacteraceae bacterium]|nr:phage BR0599 family protein [Anaeromyxobacteraceae bacterium]